MISIYHTPNGWTFCLAEGFPCCRSLDDVLKGLSYYSSLGDVMDAAYAAEDRATDYDGLPQGRDDACEDRRPAKGCSVSGEGQAGAQWL